MWILVPPNSDQRGGGSPWGIGQLLDSRLRQLLDGSGAVRRTAEEITRAEVTAGFARTEYYGPGSPAEDALMPGGIHFLI
jgi:hypothetical protein